MPGETRDASSQRPLVPPLVVLLALVGALLVVNPLVAAYGVISVGLLLLKVAVLAAGRRARAPRDRGPLAATPSLPQWVTWLPVAAAMAATVVLARLHSDYAGAAVLVALAWPVVTWILRATWFDPRVRLTVGADGMFVRRRGASGFVPWSDVEDLRLESWDKGLGGRALTVKTRGGATARLGALAGDDREARDLVRFARQQRAQYEEREAVRAAGGLDLARDGRSAGAWLEGVRALRVEHPDYRAAGVDDEILWSVVEDARAEPTARAGAAAALATKLADGDRARLRVAAGSSALPELRATLEDIAEAEAEDDVEKALGKMRG